MKILSIYFGHRSLAFLDSFLNILNKYNILVFNFKYNLEYVICLFIKLFLECFGDQGPTRWGPRVKSENKGRGPRVEEHKHTIFIYIIDKGLVIVKLHNFSIRIEIPSCPWALCGFNPLINFEIFLQSILKAASRVVRLTLRRSEALRQF